MILFIANPHTTLYIRFVSHCAHVSFTLCTRIFLTLHTYLSKWNSFLLHFLRLRMKEHCDVNGGGGVVCALGMWAVRCCAASTSSISFIWRVSSGPFRRPTDPYVQPVVSAAISDTFALLRSGQCRLCSQYVNGFSDMVRVRQFGNHVLLAMRLRFS